MIGQTTNRTALRAIWETRGIVEETLAAGTGDTLGRADDSLVDATLASDTYRTLKSGHDAPEDLLEVGPVIGRGAMGVVRSARQRALRRDVAVKELREGARPEATAALMREAWVTSQVDHPNVVPIHALYGGERSPRLVMKRIEGVPWSAAIADPAVAARLGATDRLEWHLEVLDKLCHAVHFAHSRGIVHLDLKPDNVMIGSFGEVYLLDWGIAASLRDDAPPWLPRTRDIEVVCGTPAYMAPEQAAGDGEGIGVHTDVYLLGAVLHELVTGEARHEHDSVRECLFAAWASEPFRYGADVPATLAAICRRATARDPADRYPDVEAFRLALHEYVGHRASAELVEAALERLATLEAALERDAPATPEDDAVLHRTFAECRFGLEQARRSWPDNPDIPAALHAAVTTMIEHALRARRDGEAAALLQDLPRPEPALAARVAAVREENRRFAERREELEALQRDVDPNVHCQARGRVVLIASLMFVVLNVLSGILHRVDAIPFDHVQGLTRAVVTFALYLGLVWAFRRSILATDVNRRTVVLLGAAIVSILTLFALAWHLGVAPMHTITLVFVVYVYFLVSLSLTVERRLLLPGVAILVPAGLALAAFPAYAFDIHGVTVGLLGLAYVLVERRRAAEEPTTAPAAR